TQITIRRMNFDTIALVGRENAFVIGESNYLFISEEWFDELTDAEKRFLIGHELAHLMKKHSSRNELGNTVLTFLVNQITKEIGNQAAPGSLSYYATEWAKRIGFGAVKM